MKRHLLVINSILNVGAVLGGLGLFLLGVAMMTDGLKQTAGASLRKLLSEWTNTPYRGVLSGFFMTAIVQSSSAVTVASIGFVNAGLLSMRQALGIVYGANVGTTMTAWLVALVGFKLDIQAFALPMIGVGMMLRLIKHEGKIAAFGLTLLGFGLFFVGIDVLKNAFEGIVSVLDFTKFTATGLNQVVVFLLVGLVMTVLTQSSSASIALTITAVSSGMVGLTAAAAMVIGANVGTTSTAILASIRATSNAKRVALAQVVFNVGTGIVALLILPIMIFIFDGLNNLMKFSANPSITLALFHSIFNVLGVILVLPFNDRLAGFLKKCFIARDEKLMLPMYLDKTVAATPVLAVNALLLELESVAQRVCRLISSVINPAKEESKEIVTEYNIIRHLSSEISKFIVSLERSTLSGETIQQLTTLLRIDQYLLSCANNADHIRERREKYNEIEDESIASEMENFDNAVLKILSCSAEDIDQLQLIMQGKHDAIKAMILTAGIEGRLSFDDMLEQIDGAGEKLKISQQWLKAKKNLNRIHLEIGAVNKITTEPFVNSEEVIAKEM